MNSDSGNNVELETVKQSDEQEYVEDDQVTQESGECVFIKS